MTAVQIPKLNNNDERYVLIEWLSPDGAAVSPGQALMLIETSKAQEEIEATSQGYLHPIVAAGSDCQPGQVVGQIFGTVQEYEDYLRSETPAAAPGPADDAGLVLTRGARELADSHGISLADLARLGRTVVRAADVEAILRQRDDRQAGRALARNQQAVAAIVTESMRTIPAAAVYATVNVEAALSLARQLAERDDAFVGLPELLVRAVALQHERFPLFFASLGEDGRVQEAAAPNIGVTIDAGTGLYVPVLRDAASLSIGQIADALTDLKVKALRGTIVASELAGASIMVAAHHLDGITFAMPIVFPGHVGVVSVGGTEQRLILGENGSVTSCRHVQVGLGYDHRVANGRDASNFVLAIKQALEDPRRLSDQVEP